MEKWPAADVVGVLFGDLLDVDAAHVAEEHQRLLGGAVPDDAGVVLLLDLRLRVDEDTAGHVPADLQLEDVARVGLGFLGRVGELDAAGLHAPAREHLRLDHGRTADPRGDLRRLGGVGREAVVGDGDACALDDLARLELEESHAARKPIRRPPASEPVRLGQLRVLLGEHFREVDHHLALLPGGVVLHLAVDHVHAAPVGDRLDHLLGEGDLLGIG